MQIKSILKKIFFHSKKVNETKIATLKDFIYIPTRQELKDNQPTLMLLNSYKKEYDRILSSKRIMISQDLEIEGLRNNSEMYTELLLNLINEDDPTALFENISYYNIGTKRIEYISKMAKLKSYFNELEQLYLKTQLRIIALQEILNEKLFLSTLKKNSIKEEINNLISTILTIKNRIIAIRLEIQKYLDEYSKLNNEEFVSEENAQILINEKCQELRSMILLLIPEKLKDMNVQQDNIANLVLMEKYLEEFIYNHKNDVIDLKNFISNRISVIKEDLEMREIANQLKDLELKLKAFSLYGRNLIDEIDIKNFYAIKFASLTRDMMTNSEFDIVKNATHVEIECYIDIISKKISDILTGQNQFWNTFFYSNSDATKAFISFIKSKTNDDFEYWDILSNFYLLGLIVAFDKPNGLEEYFKNIYVSKKRCSQVNFHENTYKYSRQIRIRTDEVPFFETRTETFEKKFFEFADILPLETIFRMAYYNKEKIQDSLYTLFEIMYSQVETRELTFRLPDGLISINIPKNEMSEFDIKIIELFKKLATDKDFETPLSMVEINGPLLREVSLHDIYLNEGLKKITQETFVRLKAESMHVPKSLTEIDESVFSKANICELYFTDFQDLESDGLNNRSFLSIIQHFFMATEIGDKKYHYVSDYVREKQKAYWEGRYSAFADSDLFDRDAIYQNYELKLENCSRIIIESDYIPFIIFNSDDIRVTSIRDITYNIYSSSSGYRYKRLNDGKKNMVSPITYEEAQKIYYHLQKLIKERFEKSTELKEKKKVLDKN